MKNFRTVFAILCSADDGLRDHFFFARHLQNVFGKKMVF